MCQISGKATAGRHFLVFPPNTSWTGRKSPAILAANTAVNCLLSLRPATSTSLDPSYATVHSEVGTYLIAV